MLFTICGDTCKAALNSVLCNFSFAATWVVSSTAVFWDVTQRSPKGTAAHNRTTFLSWNKPITVSVSFSRTISRQIRPLKLAQSENAFYLCIPSSETPQMNMRFPAFVLIGTLKNTGDAWMSFVCCCSFQPEEGRYLFSLANKGTKKSSSFARFNLLTASFECCSFLLLLICRKLSALDWRFQSDIFRKYKFSH